MKSGIRKSIRTLMGAAALVAQLGWVGGASAQLPMPASTQFDITGFIQEATLNAACAASAHCGGTVRINGQLITIPAETIVVFPENQLTWQELFFQAPLPWGINGTATNGAPAVAGLTAAPATTGMAAADCANAILPCTQPPLTTWEMHVVGNRVLVPNVGAPDQYIAGLVNVTQSGLHSGAGFINFIDPVLAEMRVGGPLGVAAGARVRINDPSGKYSQGTVLTSPDIRFTVDPDNPTIMSGTGYPLCLPGSLGGGLPAVCAPGNRPIDPVTLAPATKIRMANLTVPCNPLIPATCVVGAPGVLDSTLMVPFAVGDYITYTGIVVKDAPLGGFLLGDGPTVGPMPLPVGLLSSVDQTYVEAHTITSNVAVFTFPGSNPAYIMTDVMLLGTGGLTALGVGEATFRTRFEGMMTDSSRMVHLYGIDLTSAGAASDRSFGVIGVDPGPAGGGAVEGRWRFRPPCAPFGTVVLKADRQCVMNQIGTFLPIPREERSVIVDAATATIPANTGFAGVTAAGFVWGQYHAPITDYIFPENIPGTPIVENNFGSIPFLACGGYTSTTGNPGTPGTPGTLVGQLSPFPSNVVPVLDPITCVGFVAPVAGVTLSAVPTSVFGGIGTVTLTATASGATPLSFLITQAPTDLVQVLPAGGVAASTFTFPSPVVTANSTLNFSVGVTNSVTPTPVTASASVAVSLDQPIVSYTPATPIVLASGAPATLTATGVDPGGLPLSFSWVQSSGPAVTFTSTTVGAIVTANSVTCPLGSASCVISFTANVPLGTPSATVILAVTATNSNGVASAPDATSVTFNGAVGPAPTILSTEYRIGKQRLIVTASVADGSNMFLQPYVCNTAAAPCKPNAAGVWMYDPDPLHGGLGNTFTLVLGVLNLTAVGEPEPVCNTVGGAFLSMFGPPPITVKAATGGLSAAANIQKIRQ